MWDSSVVEKPERLASPDLGSVRSSTAGRLSRIKPGFYHSPSRPLFVPGWRWLGLLLRQPQRQRRERAADRRRWPLCYAVVDESGVAHQRPATSDQRTEEGDLLRQCAQRWGRRVGDACATSGIAASPAHPWPPGLAEVLVRHLRCVLRWPGRYKLLGPRTGWQPVKAWELVRGQRSWAHRLLWDARRHCQRRTGVLAVPVWSGVPTTVPMRGRCGSSSLVVARRGRGQEPWYLLTSEPVRTVEQAWQIVDAHARRWQIEMSWRSGKRALALESPRLWSGERRPKLLLLATLAYAFLLSLLAPEQTRLRHRLLRFWCPRTGKRSRDASTPLYRWRSALSRLWLAYFSATHPVLQSSG